MPTPAERIYDAAAGALLEQQTTAARLTGIMVPIGAAATAGALLLEPALHDVSHARWVQVVGLILGGIGAVLVLLVGLPVLKGPTIKGVEPGLLLEQADRPDVVDGTHDFEAEAAIALVKVRRENKSRLDRFRIALLVVFAGLVLELLGFGAATLVQPRPKPAPPVPAELRVTAAHLNVGELGIAGHLTSQAEGRVLLSIDLLGHAGEVRTMSVAIHNGRFRARVRAPRDLAPLRSATYIIIWSGSRSVRGGAIDGSLARCPEDCQ
jgi:hypothetical protein